MSPDIGLHLERKGDELIVRGVRTSIGVKLFGAAFASFSLLWIFLWNRHDAASDLAYASGFLLAAIFIVVGVSLMIPKSVTTIFDLRSRQVRRSVTMLNRWPRHSSSYAFEAVAGVGVIWSKNDEHDLTPVISLKDGTRVPLAPFWSFERTETSFSACDKSIDAICAATGLPKRDDLR